MRSQTAPQSVPVAKPSRLKSNKLHFDYAKLPLSFELNRGQTDSQVKFLSRGSGYTLFLTDREAVLALKCRQSSVVGPQSQSTNNPDVLAMKLVGANRGAKMAALDELPGKSNYFIGNDPKKWRTNVPTYAKVKYEDVYPGIDLIYYGNQRQLEYDFVVSPGADSRAITLGIETGDLKLDSRLRGNDLALRSRGNDRPLRLGGNDRHPRESGDQSSKLKIAANGDLVVETASGKVELQKPVVYQPKVWTKGSGSPEFTIQNSELLDGRYVLTAGNRVHFEISAYDRSKPLVIDPVLSYSTYLGTANYDQSNGIAVDSSGSAYVTGFTSSSAYPITAGAFQSTFGGGTGDVFVTKLSPSGSSLVYSTYLGGSTVDQATAIAIDSLGNVYVTGQTYSPNFPTTPGAFDTNYNGFGDAFISVLSADGASLLYSTYFGGSGTDVGRGIAVDSSQNIYVTGFTFSTNFPTAGALQSTNHGNKDAFVAKLSSAGSLVYSTYLGGSATDQANSIAVDASGNAYVTGYTTSPDFPTAAAAQPACKSCANNMGDVFVAEIGANGNGLVYSTFLGGSADDQGIGIAVDGLGNAFVTGSTFSTDFPTSSSAFQKSLLGGSSAFVAQITAGGSTLGYSTYLGCDDYTMGQGIAVLDGNAYVTGLTHGNTFPVVNAIQSTRAGFPGAFVTEVNGNGSALYFSTYLGGSDRDEATAIALDSSGNAYIAGLTRSADFPTVTPYQATFGGGDADSFITKIHVSPLTVIPTSITFANQVVGTKSGNKKVTVTNNSKSKVLVTGVTMTGVDSSDFTADTGCTNKSLGPGANCGFNISFVPNTTGTLTATATVDSDAVGSPPQMVLLTGTATAPVATLTPTALSFGDQAVGTTSPSQPVTLTNTGNATLSSLNISISGTNANQFQQNNKCGGSLAAGASCTINVTFKPTLKGTLTAAVTIKDNATDSPQSVPLDGTGTAGTANLSPTSLTFAGQNVGTTSSTQALTLSNTGSVAVSITSIAIKGTNSGDFAQTNNCGTSLAAGASCTINVSFTPTASGTRTASLTANDSAGNTPQTASLTGTGASPAASLSPTSLTFASQNVSTTSAAQAVTLSNTGSATLSITSIAITGTNSGDFAQTNNCGTSVAAGANCSINVTFTPTAAGTRSATLTVTDSASNSPQTASLTGTGTSGAAGLTPSSLTFTSQNVGTTSAAQAVTLSNPGSSNLSITSIAIAGANSGDFAQTNNCGTSVAAGASCTINVTFAPTATGSRTGTLTVTDNAPNSPQTTTLTGTGVAPAASLSPTSLTFASQSVGTTSAPQAVTLSNTGSAALSITSIAITGANSGDFAQTNNCGASVAAGANCTINVTFTPTATGTRTATLAVTDNASGSPHTASLTGTGASSTAPVTLSPTSLTFASQNVGTTSAAQSLTLTNSQSVALTIISVAITGTNPGDFAQTNNCGVLVAAGGTCTINVTFTPTATGSRTGTLTVTDSASNSPQTAGLTGAGATIGAGPTVTQVQNNLDTSGSAFTSFSVNITTNPGDLLVAFVRESSNGTDNFTVTDSAGQTWTQTASGYKNESSSGPRIGMLYIANSAAVTSVTVNFSTAGGVIKPGIMVMDISGAASSAVADGSVNNASGATVTTSSSGSLTTTNANDILIFATDTSGNETGWTAGSGFTIPNNLVATGASGSNIRMAMQYAIAGSALTNTTTTMGYANSNWNANIFAAFK